MYIVTKFDHCSRINEVVHKTDSLYEAIAFREGYVYDYVVSKVGDHAVDFKSNCGDAASLSSIGKLIWGPTIDERGEMTRKVVKCLHREYSYKSSNWAKVEYDYFITRNPMTDSVYKLTVHSKIVNNKVWADTGFEKIMSVDVCCEPREVYIESTEDNPKYDYEDPEFFHPLAELMKKFWENVKKAEEILAEETENDLQEKKENQYNEQAQQIL